MLSRGLVSVLARGSSSVSACCYPRVARITSMLPTVTVSRVAVCGTNIRSIRALSSSSASSDEYRLHGIPPTAHLPDPFRSEINGDADPRDRNPRAGPEDLRAWHERERSHKLEVLKRRERIAELMEQYRKEKHERLKLEGKLKDDAANELTEEERVLAFVKENPEKISFSPLYDMLHENIAVCARRGELQLMWSLYTQLETAGYAVSESTLQQMVTTCGKVGDIRGTVKCLRKMWNREYNVRSSDYDSALTAAARNGSQEDVWWVLRHMQRRNATPTLTTLAVLHMYASTTAPKDHTLVKWAKLAFCQVNGIDMQLSDADRALTTQHQLQ
jgi:hypothetical protein